MSDPYGHERLHFAPAAEIIPLDEIGREQYPHVIYEWGGAPVESLVFSASVIAARELGLPLTIDQIVEREFGLPTIQIRTASADRHQQRLESALIQGLSGAVEKGLYGHGGGDGGSLVATADPSEAALVLARNNLAQVLGDESFYEAFKEYYGGLRWGLDQEKFIRALFVHSAEYDPAFLDANLTGNDLGLLTYELDADIPYAEHREWSKKSPAEIFASRPELDYRRLDSDPAYAETAEGRKLREAYRKHCGEQQANVYKAYPQPISETGTLVPKPVIPLTKFPLIESLMADEVVQSGPRGKYSMGPSEVVQLIVDSDSAHALNYLVRGLGERLPREARHPFDGPSELEHKRGTVHTILRAYEQSYGDPERREPLKRAVLDIFAAYTEGYLARDVLDEFQQLPPDSQKWFRDIRDVKQIVNDILTVAITSPDANDFVAALTVGSGAELATSAARNAFLPSQRELMVLVLDGLKRAGSHSDPRILQRMAAAAFQDEALATRIGHIAELEVTAARVRSSPEVLLALKGVQRFHLHYDNKPNPEKDAAVQHHMEVRAPAEELARRASAALNAILLERMNLLADSGVLLESDQEAAILFNSLMERVSFTSDLGGNQLPDVYPELVALACKETISDTQRSKIFWQFAERMKYAGEGVQLLLPETILDMYRAALGPVEAIRTPGSETSHLLAAATYLATSNNILAHASEDQLLLLRRYTDEVVYLFKQASSGHLLPASPEGATTSSAEDYQELLRNLEYAAREVVRIEEQYSQYLHIEEVKRDPAVYFPWLTNKLRPFWGKMLWEVGPGNRPKPEITALHGVLQQFITNLQPVYPPGFDYLGEGGLGDFLLECHQRMVVPHDIKYNSTVWQAGLPFLHTAVAYMPPALLGALKKRYARYPQFVAYLEATWARDRGNEADGFTEVIG